MGAKIGLIISGVILLIVLAIVGWVMLAKPSLGDPTEATTAAGKLEVMELGVDPSDLVAMKSGTGAEKIYEGVVADMMKSCGDSPDEFKTSIRTTKKLEAKPEYMAMLGKLEQAADMGMGSDVELNFKALPITPITEFHSHDGLYGLAVLACNVAMDARADKKPEESAKALRAAFIFGQRLWTNGVYVPYKSAGLGAMNEALAGYAAQYRPDMFPEGGKAARVKEIQESMKVISVRFMTKEKIPHTNPNHMELGDLWNLAANDKDRAWRIEGISWLGVGQWTAARKHGQREVIQELLRGWSTSNDPLIKEAATNALAFERRDCQSIPTD